MKTVDFSTEISEHVIWNVRLKCFLDGGECISEEQAVSHHKCTLGKWLYTHGMDKYRMMPEMRELEKNHIELHAIVKQVIQMKSSGNTHAAELELAKLRLISRKLITLIMTVEYKINQSVSAAFL